MNLPTRHTAVRSVVLAACIVSLAIRPPAAGSAAGAAELPVLWTAGGLSAGTDSAGNAARIATDAWGNVAVVSGPSGGRHLAVTSYAAGGTLRWIRTVAPDTGTFLGDWIVAAPNGDFVAIGHNQDSRGRPIACTMLRYDSGGNLLWRVDFSAPFRPVVGRVVVDAEGSAYVAWSAVGSGLFVQKYSASGALLWTQNDVTGGGYAVASSLALSPDGLDVAVTGSVSGGATWITAVHDAATGARRWHVAAPEGTGARDVVVDDTGVYVTGGGVTGAGTPALAYHLTVVAYERETGARLWRTDRRPADGSGAAGFRMAMAPDGSLVVTGQANRGFLDWYTVAFETTGAVRWEAIRDGGLNTDEIPAGVLVLPGGTAVVTGKGGPNLPGGYIPGVTAGYSPNGELLWEGFSRMATVWATALPDGNVCAAGGYDALITCWRVPGAVSAAFSAAPAAGGSAPLPVSFTNLSSGNYDTCLWSFGDGGTSTSCGDPAHLYTEAGVYTVALTVSGPGGTDTRTRPDYITVYEPVIAGFAGSPTGGSAPLTVSFTNQSSGDYDTCAWTFGDGGTSSSCGGPAHTYTAAGIYTVSLTVSGPGGSDTEVKPGYVAAGPVEYRLYLPLTLSRVAEP